MFEHVLSIDVKNRLDEFDKNIKPYAHKYSAIHDLKDLTPINTDADALFVSIYKPLDAKFLNKLKHLKAIFVLGTTNKHIDMAYCDKHQIKVFVVPDYCDHETAEWVVLQLLNHFRSGSIPRTLYKKHIGLIGVGAVGQEVIKMAYGFSMLISYNANSEKPKAESLNAIKRTKEEIFKTADIISFHTPAHLKWLDENQCLKLKKNAVLVDTTMGGVFKENVLANILHKRKDITVIADAIANFQQSAPNLINKNEKAFHTIESQHRLQEKFWHNVKHYKK